MKLGGKVVREREKELIFIKGERGRLKGLLWFGN